MRDIVCDIGCWPLAVRCYRLLPLTSLDGELDARSQCDAGEGIREEVHREGRYKAELALSCFVAHEFAKRRRPLAGFLSGLFDHIQLDLG